MNRHVFDCRFGRIGYDWSQWGVKRILLGCRQDSGGLVYKPLQDCLDSYLVGGTLGFQDILLDVEATSFQEKVYSIVSKIPFGEVRTYRWVAKELGLDGGCQAVGAALKNNPVPLVIPCHRVVSAGGLGGFSAGLDWKEILLAHEGVNTQGK